MKNQTVIETQVTMEGAPFTVRLINNPTVDDILIGEMFGQATSIWRGDDMSEHRVPRNIRDYLIRLGVER